MYLIKCGGEYAMKGRRYPAIRKGYAMAYARQGTECVIIGPGEIEIARFTVTEK